MTTLLQEPAKRCKRVFEFRNVVHSVTSRRTTNYVLRTVCPTCSALCLTHNTPDSCQTLQSRGGRQPPNSSQGGATPEVRTASNAGFNLRAIIPRGPVLCALWRSGSCSIRFGTWRGSATSACEPNTLIAAGSKGIFSSTVSDTRASLIQRQSETF